MKNYWLSFGADNPQTFTGLAPSFIQFFDQSGSTLAAPGITEIFTGSGAYNFKYDVGFSSSVWFLVDGGATLSLSNRYIRGVLDASQKLDEIIGFTGSGFGSTSINPGDVMGMLKRTQEVLEGNQTYLKSTGEWSIFSRGSSTLLSSKIISSNTTGVTRL